MFFMAGGGGKAYFESGRYGREHAVSYWEVEKGVHQVQETLKGYKRGIQN
jgi:hypothetical protein